MTILTRPEILAAIAAGRILSTPPIDEALIKGAQIDVTLGGFAWLHTGNQAMDLRYSDPRDFFTLVESDVFTLPPFGFGIFCTEQFIGTAKDSLLIPMWDERSTPARWGLFHTKSGFGDMRFHGRWAKELFNATNSPMTLRRGDRIGSISFHEVRESANYQGHYHTTPKAWRPEDLLPKMGNM